MHWGISPPELQVKKQFLFRKFIIKIKIMHKLFFILLVAGSVSLYAQKPIFGTAKLHEALVYLNGVELSHSVNVLLRKGSNEVVVKNIANQLDENSIRIGTSKPATIMSATFTTNYYSEYEVDENSEIFKKIKDSIRLVNTELNNVKNKIETDRQTINLLDKNQSISGSNTGVSVVELTKLVDYYRQKRLEIANSINLLQDKQGKLNETLQRLQNQLAFKEENEEKISTGKIVLQVMSEVEQIVRLDISYISNLASWKPSYEIESKGLSQSLQVTSKGSVRQTTGLDWKQVKLSLSSSQPNPNNAIPYYSIWNINSAAPYTRPTPSSVAPAAMYDKKKAESAGAYKEDMYYETTADYTAVFEQTLSINYAISIPYDIYTNGKDHAVTLSKQDIPATYSYYSAPKLSTNAYLIAYMTDYSKYNLLAGEANILLEGTYVGKTYLNPAISNDTMEIALGIDKNVVIKREKVVEKSGNKIVSANKESSFVYEISVRNNKSIATTIEVKDQFPISANKEIVVELTQSDNAAIDQEQGTLTWKMNLKPQETKKVRFGYKVKYPKSMTVYNL